MIDYNIQNDGHSPALQWIWGGTIEITSVEAFPEKSRWRSRRDVLRQSVPQSPGIKRRPAKLHRRRLKDGCVGRQAMMTKQSGDADGPRYCNCCAMSFTYRVKNKWANLPENLPENNACHNCHATVRLANIHCQLLLATRTTDTHWLTTALCLTTISMLQRTSEPATPTCCSSISATLFAMTLDSVE